MAQGSISLRWETLHTFPWELFFFVILFIWTMSKCFRDSGRVILEGRPSMNMPFKCSSVVFFRVFVSQSECQREADIWLFHDWCTCLERALEAFSGFVILCFRNWRLKFLKFFPTYSLFLCYATLTLVNRLDVSERILLFDHNVDCFFFVPSDGGHAHCGSSLFKITQLKINIRAD